MLEGTIRFMANDPAESSDDMSPIQSRAVTGGSFEIFFGGLGFLLGINVICFSFHLQSFTAITLLVEVLMGIYVFVVFTLEIPIHWGHTGAGNPGAASYPSDSFENQETANAALVFGSIFGSMTLCALLQSLQLLCTIGLYSVQTKSSPLSASNLHVFSLWTIALVFMYGLSTFIFGVMVMGEEGSGFSDEVYMFPPHAVKHASHTITSGVLVSLLAVFLASCLIDFEKMVPLACAWAIFTWVWLLSGEVLTQFSLASRDSGGSWTAPAAQVVGLFTVLVFGPLFVLGEGKRQRVHEEEADVGAQEFSPDAVKLSGDNQYEGARSMVGGL